MRRNAKALGPLRQQGAAILLMLLLIFLVSTYWILGNGSAVAARLEFDRETARNVSLAKQALIGRAAMDANRPGSLPCPDSDGDGVADLFSGSACPAYIGRLPWKTLKTANLRDGYGEELWYALSPALRDHASAEPINPTRPLELTLDGVANIAAIVFSAGPPQADQNGRSSNALADYLEGSNRDGDFAYVSGPFSATFNDQATSIAREEIFRTINQRVLAEVRGPDDNSPAPPTYGLRHYLSVSANLPLADGDGDGGADVATPSGHLPYVDLALNSSASFPPFAWMNSNGWLALVGYQRLSATSARLSLGSNQMNVVPCPGSPCP